MSKEVTPGTWEAEYLRNFARRPVEPSDTGAVPDEMKNIVQPTGEQLYAMVMARFKSGVFPWSFVSDSGKAAWDAAASDLAFLPDSIMANFGVPLASTPDAWATPPTEPFNVITAAYKKIATHDKDYTDSFTVALYTSPQPALAPNTVAVPDIELARLREIEHRVWHLLDNMQSEGVGDNEILTIDAQISADDLEVLNTLLPEDHPPVDNEGRALLAAQPEQALVADCGHGWVHARADGMKAKCGGPGLCQKCKADLAALAQVEKEPTETDNAAVSRVRDNVANKGYAFLFDDIATLMRCYDAKLIPAQAENSEQPVAIDYAVEKREALEKFYKYFPEEIHREEIFWFGWNRGVSAAAVDPANTVEPVDKPAVIEFGSGKVVLNWGTYENKPCVFISVAKNPGVVGESAAREKIPKNEILPGDVILTFPTMDQVRAVEAALYGIAGAPVDLKGGE